jgi:hypothetical protein
MGRISSRVVYAALGDSMSIDDYAGGRGRGAASLVWRNRDADAARRAIGTVVDKGRLVLASLRALMGPEAPIVVATHRALVAEVHARFLGHGLAAGDPTQPAARPPDRDLWYCGLIEPNAWGASQIRASFWEALRRAGSC